MEKYRFFSHTADIGLEVFGRTLPELFTNAAEGLYSLLLTEPPHYTETVVQKISLSGSDNETLFVEWLNELIYRAYSDRKYFDKMKIEIRGNKLSAVLSGYNFRCCFKHEIKAATYHNLKIEKLIDGFKTKIIFDI